MSTDGSGEWQKWNRSAFFGAPFVWTTLHDFGGTDGMKGNLAHIDVIPFAALPPAADTGVFGTGYTPEGIDQNPIYYEFMTAASFRSAPVDDLTGWAVLRAYRRYGIAAPLGSAPAVEEAWGLLVNSTYSQDLSVQDGACVCGGGP